MMDELVAHKTFEFALHGRIRWSNNVMEERQAPTQLILGANDPDFCTLLNVGLYLEHLYPSERNSDGELNCFSLSGNTDSSKARAARILKEIFVSHGFQERLGSHAPATSYNCWALTPFASSLRLTQGRTVVHATKLT